MGFPSFSLSSPLPCGLFFSLEKYKDMNKKPDAGLAIWLLSPSKKILLSIFALNVYTSTTHLLTLLWFSYFLTCLLPCVCSFV